jgi:outer membrane protein assembly factor BamB
MKSSRYGSAVLVIKPLLCLAFAAIAVFFIVQVSMGARDATGSALQVRSGDNGYALGEAIYGSLKGFLDDLTASRAYFLTPVWQLAVGGEAFIEEEGGVLYLTSNQGQVMAVDAASGNIIWSLDLGVWVSAPPAVQAGVVYVGATDHVLYALDAGSGALLWYYTAQGEILAQPVVNGDEVFFTADNDSVYDLVHRLYALDARSGTPIWIYDTESWTPSAPAVGEDAVYLGGYRREVYALDKLTGRELWSFKASNIVFSSPQIVAGQVLFTCIDGWVHALDAASGVSLWSRKLPGFVWLAPPDDSDHLYACSHRDTLTALALDSGEELWSFDDGNLISCATLTEEGAVCAFNEEGNAYLLDAADGKSFGILRAPYGFTSPPLLVGKRIYAGSQDGFVRAYALPQVIR